MKAWKKNLCFLLIAGIASAAFPAAGLTQTATPEKKTAQPAKAQPAKTQPAKTQPAKTQAAAPAAKDTEIIARVNGVPIPQSELVRMMAIIQMQYARAGKRIPPEQMPELRNKLMDRLIGDELLWQATQKAGIKPDHKSAEAKIAEIKAKYPSDVEFVRTLERQKLTEDELLHEIERGEAVQKFMVDKFLSKSTPTDAEVKKFYDDNPDSFKVPEQVKASHILVSVDQNASDADKKKARKKIEEAAQKVKKGEDFAKVAKEYSDCPSAKQGGDLGYFGRGQMVPPFEEAVFALKPGQVSGIVETRFGYHIIKCEEKKPGSVVTFDKVKENITRELTNRAAEAEVTKFVGEARKKAKVEILISDLAMPDQPVAVQAAQPAAPAKPAAATAKPAAPAAAAKPVKK